MANEKDPKKAPSLVESMKQDLIDKLVAASIEAKNDDGSIDSEKLRKEQLAVLGKYDAIAGVAAETFTQLGADLSATQQFSEGGARKLDELLVSEEAWPFKDISELSDRFGPLPKGYCYRYLAPETVVVPKEISNLANNVIRIPSATDLGLEAQLDRPGDEIPDRSLGDWLGRRPVDLVRSWTLRVLSLLGVLKASEIPSVGLPSGSVPSAGARSHPVSFENPKLGPEIAELINDFREQSVFQYDGEEQEDDVSALGGVCAKRDIFDDLEARGPEAVSGLRTLLNDADIGVRVSAATYLLPSAPNLASQVLLDVVAHWSKQKNEERAYNAFIHARQALWMYEDGNLRLGNGPLRGG
jgi:hypothetical protein